MVTKKIKAGAGDHWESCDMLQTTNMWWKISHLVKWQQVGNMFGSTKNIQAECLFTEECFSI